MNDFRELLPRVFLVHHHIVHVQSFSPKPFHARKKTRWSRLVLAGLVQRLLGLLASVALGLFAVHKVETWA